MSNADESFEGAFSRLHISEAPLNHKAVEAENVIDEDDEEQEGPFYVHIDILRNATGKGRIINSYMLRKYYFDPRRYFNFFDQVFDLTEGAPTLSEMRNVCVPAMSNSYYELWKVKGDFSVSDFFDHLANNGFEDTAVRITCMYDGDHAIYRKEY
jgi:hypothetical protein